MRLALQGRCIRRFKAAASLKLEMNPDHLHEFDRIRRFKAAASLKPLENTVP